MLSPGSSQAIPNTPGFVSSLCFGPSCLQDSFFFFFFKLPFLLVVLVFNHPTVSNSFIHCILFERFYMCWTGYWVPETGEQNRPNLSFHTSQW